MLQQSHTPLANGIMSFMVAPEDHELAPIELAPIGIGSMHEQAQKLAEYGRHGDIYFVHAAEGETVVPMEVLNANPKVKDMLFNQMREMGLDPDEFVVGNELNSINPVTGMPEFFFSSLWRKTKKVASKVVKFAKKAAPYVIPLVLSVFGVPFLSGLSPALFGSSSFGAAFLGSGIGTLAGGGSMKDALKAGAMAGVMNFGLSGARSAFTGGDFMQGAMESVYNPQAATFGTQWDRFTGALDPAGAAGSFDAFVGGQAPGAAPTVAPPVQPPDISAVQPPDISAFGDMSYGPGAAAPTPSVPGGAGHYLATRGGGPPIGTNLAARTPLPSVAQGPGLPQYAQVSTPSASPQAAFQQPTTSPVPGADYMGADFRGAYPAETFRAGPYARAAMAPVPVQPNMSALGDVREIPGTIGDYQRTTWDRIGDIASDTGTTLEGWGKTASDILTGGKPTNSEIFQKANELMAMDPSGRLTFDSAVEMATKDLTPGMLRAYGPTLALGTAGYAGYEAMQPDPGKLEEQEKQKLEDERRERLRRYHETTGAYNFYQSQKGGRDNPDYWRYRIPVGANPNPNPWRGTRLYAEGGMAEYPRRDLLVEGPGTERSDDIPAMLSDGEFVMNAKAVRGADPSGGGNRYAGASNLYNMMRNFEMRS